jgi:peptide-methionine (S)-S-oxide reductase
MDSPQSADGLQTAVFAGGCFWGVQGVYQRVDGVEQVLSGYSGGAARDARYEAVSSGGTGHAESVQVVFDPSEVTYGKLLQIFFSVAHDPTQLNRQGPDYGPQYRSNVFYANEEQKKIAEAYIEQLNASGAYDRPLVTRLDPLDAFYPAEDYHQDYLIEHPRNRYIVINDLPKIENLKDLFPELYRDEPVRSR